MTATVKKLKNELYEMIDVDQRLTFDVTFYMLDDKFLENLLVAILVYVRYGKQMEIWDDVQRYIYDYCILTINPKFKRSKFPHNAFEFL